jgi:S-adenosylmethionine:tRNA ribosyltransferase-isomerase
MSELEQYDFQLPEERIAQHPLAQRVDARLLVVNRQTQDWETCHVRDLPDLLRPNDLLVTNDTRVVPARLVGVRQRTGGKWSGLFLQANEDGFWRILSKTRGRLEPGEIVELHHRAGSAQAQLVMIQRLDGGAWLAKPSIETSPWELLDLVGRVPLPPYIRGGEMEDGDVQSYQTVFAERPGAVAAPTAGLHFTEALLDKIRARGVQTRQVTLHVGEGTFRPIQTERLDDHPMHAEWGELTADAARDIGQHREARGRVVAVGTTSVRVLESAAAAHAGVLSAWSGETDLFIRPPYEFQAIDALMTNFHLPKSTLMVLVCTLGGRDLIMAAYNYAVAEKFRFYSYGDAMLIV